MEDQSPGPMRRRNLTISAVITVVLIGGLAWYGERTHGIPFRPVKDPIAVLKPMPPFEVEPAERTPDPSQEQKPAEKKPIPDSQEDQVAPRPSDAFTQPVEPPPVVATEHNSLRDVAMNVAPGPDAFDPSQVDQMPAVRFQARPEYPHGMQAGRISGEVLVDFIVDRNGGVTNAFAVSASRQEFEAAAVGAVSRWRFTPGLKGGRAVAVHMRVPIVFSLGDGR
jgi:protein TonB